MFSQEGGLTRQVILGSQVSFITAYILIGLGGQYHDWSTSWKSTEIYV